MNKKQEVSNILYNAVQCGRTMIHTLSLCFHQGVDVKMCQNCGKLHFTGVNSCNNCGSTDFEVIKCS